MTTENTKATDAVKELAEKHGGIITPEILIDAAKRKSSPLHQFFEWDDTAAARQFRLIQAANLIRRIKVTVQTAAETTIRIRAFANVRGDADSGDADSAKGFYVPIQDALKNVDWRAQVIAQCKRDVQAFKQKYAVMREASQIIDAMEQFTKHHN